VKPVDGVASLHIHPVDGPEDAETAWQALQEADTSAVIAEEYLDGPVVSVDSFSHAGRHLTIGYSEYRMNDRYV
ncbi:biotin carboxylase, partial [Streptomyces sp. SID8455]|nr:biotin carboxylase [Streptomyces sp. SID8455]